MITTALPTPLVVGVNEVIVGLATVDRGNAAALVAEPAAVLTLILPFAGTPTGTVAVICESESTWKLAATPPNVTAFASVKCEPVITTDVPTSPLAGENDVICGLAATANVNAESLLALPEGDVTEILPFAGAAAGTIAEI